MIYRGRDHILFVSIYFSDMGCGEFWQKKIETELNILLSILPTPWFNRALIKYNWHKSKTNSSLSIL